MIFVIKFVPASYKGQFELQLDLYIDPRTTKLTVGHFYLGTFQAGLGTKNSRAASSSFVPRLVTSYNPHLIQGGHDFTSLQNGAA